MGTFLISPPQLIYTAWKDCIAVSPNMPRPTLLPSPLSFSLSLSLSKKKLSQETCKAGRLNKTPPLACVHASSVLCVHMRTKPACCIRLSLCGCVWNMSWHKCLSGVGNWTLFLYRKEFFLPRNKIWRKNFGPAIFTQPKYSFLRLRASLSRTVVTHNDAPICPDAPPPPRQDAWRCPWGDATPDCHLSLSPPSVLFMMSRQFSDRWHRWPVQVPLDPLHSHTHPHTHPHTHTHIHTHTSSHLSSSLSSCAQAEQLPCSVTGSLTAFHFSLTCPTLPACLTCLAVSSTDDVRNRGEREGSYDHDVWWISTSFLITLEWIRTLT